MKLHELKIEKKHKAKCFKATKNYIVYKHVFGSPCNGIAILVIPKGTKIVCARGYGGRGGVNSAIHKRKLRSEKAYCIGIIPYEGGEYQSFVANGSPIAERYYSMKKNHFNYEVGQELIPEIEFDSYGGDFCRSGIHFFASLKDAENYTSL